MSDKPQQTEAAPGKSQRSSVYIYLAVLFAAAFLMLLLAYFVQQRNNESTISGLQNSWNLSRAELVAENNQLRQELEALGKEVDQWKGDSSRWQTRYEEQARELDDLQNRCDIAQEALTSWRSIWVLEQFYQAGDYESCAAVLLAPTWMASQLYSNSSTEDRQTEIVRAVIDAGILDEDYMLHPEDYADLVDSIMSAEDASRETER